MLNSFVGGVGSGRTYNNLVSGMWEAESMRNCPKYKKGRLAPFEYNIN